MAKQPGRLQWFHKLWAAGYGDTPEEQSRHKKTSWWLALGIIPLMVMAHSVTGFVFGSQSGQSGWFSALQAPSFVVMAGISGLGMIIILTAIMRKVLKVEELISKKAFQLLGNILWIMTAVYLYFILIEGLTATWVSPEGEGTVYRAMISGDYSWMFWLSAGLLGLSFLILFSQFIMRRYSISIMVFAAILVSIAAVLKRYLLVVPSQTHGNILPFLDETGSYSASWVEYMVVLGLIGLGILLYIGFTKIFPIMEISGKMEGGISNE